MTTLSVTEARARLLSLARSLGEKHGEAVPLPVSEELVEVPA